MNNKEEKTSPIPVVKTPVSFFKEDNVIEVKKEPKKINSEERSEFYIS